MAFLRNIDEFFYGRRSEPGWIVNSSRDVPYYYEIREANPHTHHVSPYITDALHNSHSRHILPVVELKVPMCCAKCEEKVKEELLELEGVYGVVCDQYTQKVIVSGHVDPLRALKKAKRVKKKSQLWPSPAYRQYDGEYSSSESRGYLHHDQTEYRSSHSRYTPAFGQSYVHSYGQSYRQAHSQSIITNPHYLKHIESEY